MLNAPSSELAQNLKLRWEGATENLMTSGLSPDYVRIVDVDGNGSCDPKD